MFYYWGIKRKWMHPLHTVKCSMLAYLHRCSADSNDTLKIVIFRSTSSVLESRINTYSVVFFCKWGDCSRCVHSEKSEKLHSVNVWLQVCVLKHAYEMCKCVCAASGLVYASYGGLHHHMPSSELRTLFDGALLSKQVSGVPSTQAGLDLEHGGHGPAEASAPLHPCVAGGGSFRGAGLVLKQLEEGVHVRSQSGHQTSSDCCHGFFVALHQALQESAVIPNTDTDRCNHWQVFFWYNSNSSTNL